MSNSDMCNCSSVLWTVEEVAEYFQVDKRTIWRWVNTGTEEFPKPSKIGERTLRWKKDIIVNWVDSKTPAGRENICSSTKSILGEAQEDSLDLSDKKKKDQ